jgi:TonB family protein
MPHHLRLACRAALALLASGAWLAAAPPAAGQGYLLNGSEIQREIAARYPPAMREGGVSGRVRLRLRVLPDSTVDPSSVAVEWASDAAFVEPATSLIPRMRFAPAAVPVWIRHSVEFEVRGPDPDEGTYELSAVEEMPRLLNAAEVARQIEARYPPALVESGVTGYVLLRFRVMENGTVDPETIGVDVSTHLELEEPAVTVARSMRFRPARVSGRPIPVWLTIPIHFSLQ